MRIWEGDYVVISDELKGQIVEMRKIETIIQQGTECPDGDQFDVFRRNQEVASMLGDYAVNASKHGFSARRLGGRSENYLAIKNVTIHKDMHATWNDLPPERAEAYKDPWVKLAVAVRKYGEIQFICFGGNARFGNHLCDLVEKELLGGKKTVVPIKLVDLVNEYGFHIYAETRMLKKIPCLLSKYMHKLYPENKIVKDIAALRDILCI